MTAGYLTSPVAALAVVGLLPAAARRNLDAVSP
jgi:hypothetical protein